MTYTATIIDALNSDAPPLWESFDHPTLGDAFRAAEAHIHGARSGDRIQADPAQEAEAGTSWTISSEAGDHVARLIVDSDDDPTPAHAPGAQSGAEAWLKWFEGLPDDVSRQNAAEHFDQIMADIGPAESRPAPGFA